MVSLVDLYRAAPGNRVVSPTLRQVAAQAPQTMVVQDDEPWYMEMLNPDKSALGSFLQWIDRPGQVVRNVLRGDLGAAGRQAVDFLGDTADAFLPGDLIGETTTRGDYLQFSDLVGGEDLPWYLKLPLDVAGGVVTDPLSLLTFGGSGAASAVARGVRQAANPARVAASTSKEALKASDDAAKALLRTARTGVNDIQGMSPLGREILSNVDNAGEDALQRLMNPVRAEIPKRKGMSVVEEIDGEMVRFRDMNPSRLANPKDVSAINDASNYEDVLRAIDDPSVERLVRSNAELTKMKSVARDVTQRRGKWNDKLVSKHVRDLEKAEGRLDQLKAMDETPRRLKQISKLESKIDDLKNRLEPYGALGQPDVSLRKALPLDKKQDELFTLLQKKTSLEGQINSNRRALPGLQLAGDPSLAARNQLREVTQRIAEIQEGVKASARAAAFTKEVERVASITGKSTDELSKLSPVDLAKFASETAPPRLTPPLTKSVDMADAEALSLLLNKKKTLEQQLKKANEVQRANRGRIDGAGGVDAVRKQVALERELRAVKEDAVKLLEGNKAKTAAKFGDPAAAEAIKQQIGPILEINLTASVRRELAKQGPDAIPQFIKKVADEIGTNTSVDHVRSVLSKYPKAFDQGGVRLINRAGGVRIKAFDTAYDAAVAGLGKTIDRLPPRGREAIKAIGKTTSNIGLSLRKTLGSQWFNINPFTKSLQKQAAVAGASTTEHYVSEISKVFNGIDKQYIEGTERAISNVFDNVIDLRKSGGVAEELVPRLDRKDVNIDRIMERIDVLRAKMPDADKVDWNAVRRIVPEVYAINKDMLKKGADAGLFDSTMQTLVRGNDSYLFREYTGTVRDADGNLIRDFGARAGSIEDDLLGPSASSAFNKGRTLGNDDDLVRFLNNNPDVALEPSAMRRMVKRAERQGQAIARAEVAKGLLGPAYTTLGESAVPIAKMIGAMAEVDPQFAAYLQAMTTTMRGRRGLFPMLAKVNKAFKPAAVYQLFLPKVASVPRNLLGGAWQAGSSIGYDQAMLQLRNLPKNFVDSLGVYLKQARRGLFGKKDVIDLHGATAATVANVMKETPEFGASLGDDIRFVASLEGLPLAERIAKAQARDPLLAEAVRYGVLDGFVSSEQLLKVHFRNQALNRVADVATAPGAMFQHAEGAMRYAAYKQMRQQGLSAEAARQFQSEAFIDYGVDFIENRTLRDLLPFAAFTTGTIAQQSKLIAKKPAVAVAMAQLYGQNTDFPLMPWIQDTPSFQYGTGEDGNPLVAAGLGLPFEALGIIPNISGSPQQLGESLRSGVVGSSHPLLKYTYGRVTGQDPFFGGPFASYDATPYSLQALGMSDRSEFSRLYRELSSTGLIQPLVGVMNTFDKLLDPRMDASSRALNLLTGMRIVANDPDKAAFRILQDKLASDPSIKQATQYYGGSDEMDNALRALREAAKRMKEKREAREQAKLDE